MIWAVIAQLFYVGAQASIWGITINYVIELIPNTSMEIASSNYLAAGTLLFVIGRFLGTFLMTFIKDYKILAFYGIAASILSMAGIFAEGKLAVYSVLAINFFMSIMFPTIFALGVKDLNEHTKLGSSLIIMAIVGGAIFPPIVGLMADSIGIQESFVIPTICFFSSFLLWISWLF